MFFTNTALASNFDIILYMNNAGHLELPETSIPLIRRLKELWQFSERAMRGQTFETQGDLRLIILLQITTITSRTIHSALTQINGNSFYGLDFLLRPLVEGLINYKYIKEDPTRMRARAFIADDIRIRLSNVRRLIPLLERNQAPGMATVADAQRYRQLEAQLEQEQTELTAQYGEENLRFPSLEARARASGTLEIYATAYWLLCQDTHLTARGLDRYMREENGQLSITWDQDLDRFHMHIRTFYIIFSALLAECSEQFGIPNMEELKQFEQIP